MIEEFEKYMDKPNLVYFVLGIAYIAMGGFFSYNPVMAMHVSPTFYHTLDSVNSTPILSLVFNPWFYWIFGSGHIGITITYWLIRLIEND